MSEVCVRKVSTEAENQVFLRMPWVVYKGNPNWVAPLWREHVRYFDPQYNAELQHVDLEKFIAWREEKPVGTIIAHVNRAYNEFHNVNVGWFGQLEVLEDQTAAYSLLETAEDWIKSRGAKAIMGPATFSSNGEWGLLIDGFEIPPMIMMPYAQPYYKSFVEGYGGFNKVMDLWAWRFDGEKWGGKKVNKLPESLTRIVEKIKSRGNFTTRPLNMRCFAEEVERIKTIYNRAFIKNWGFIPLNDAETDKIASDLKDILDPHMVIFIEVKGEPVGFGIPLPNIYEPLRKVHSKPGEPAWLQLLKLIWHWKIRQGVTSVRIWGLGVLKEYRRSGVDGLLYYEMIKAGLPRGYRIIEMSWILAENDMMNRGVAKLGAEICKTYRVYEKEI